MQDDIKALLQVASSPNPEDPAPLDALIHTSGWETLMTFAREISRKLFPFSLSALLTFF